MKLLPIKERHSGDERCDNLACRQPVRGDSRDVYLREHLCGCCRMVYNAELARASRGQSPEIQAMRARMQRDADAFIYNFIRALQAYDARQHGPGLRVMTDRDRRPPRSVLLHSQIGVPAVAFGHRPGMVTPDEEDTTR